MSFIQDTHSKRLKKVGGGNKKHIRKLNIGVKRLKIRMLRKKTKNKALKI